LEKDPNVRISASEAISHPFFNTYKEANQLEKEKIQLFISNLKKYKADYKLQQAAIALIVHNMPHSEEIRELEQAFRLIDDNGDGRLTKEEMFKGYKKIFNKPDEEIKKDVENIFLAVDADKNGYLEYEEFIRACVDKEKLLNNNNLRFAFNFFDKDGSGSITCDEIKEVFCSGGSNNNFNIDKIIKDIDTNGDGEVSFDEFKEMMKKNYSLILTLYFFIYLTVIL